MGTPTTNIQNENAAFKATVNAWLAEQKLTKKELSRLIDVSYGTVRNWFSSDLGIGEESRKRIEKLMRNPALLKETAKTPEEVVYWQLYTLEANLPMWRSAADAEDVDFNPGPYSPNGEDSRKFAKWSTIIINQAIKEELRKHDRGNIAKIANTVRISGDPLCRKPDEQGNNFSGEVGEFDEDFSDRTLIKLPVIYGAINNLYLSLAAICAKVKRDDFITAALNADAQKAFGDELNEFLDAEDAPLDERVNSVVETPTKPDEEDDIPF